MDSECIRVRLLGSLEVQRRSQDGTWSVVEREAWGKPKHARSVLKRLLTAPGRRLSRSQIQDDLWPEIEMQLADSYLYNAVTKIRGAIGRELVSNNDSVYEIAGQSVVWVDTDQVKASMCQIENQGHCSTGTIALLKEALGYLERGAALEGEDGTWCYSLRREAEDMLRQVRIWLAEHYDAHEKIWQAGEQYRALCAIMPPDDRNVQAWMTMLVRHEKRQEALRCYEEVNDICVAQGYMLSAETVQLAKQIRDVVPDPSAAPARLSRRSMLVAGTGALVGLTDGLAGLWADDLLAVYSGAITACQDLYFGGSPYQVAALLPLYRTQSALLAQQPGILQRPAARLASLAAQLACELATDREDFGAAQLAAQQAFLYAQLARDANLQVASLIEAANLGFHRKQSLTALHAYEHAVALFDEQVTPLLKGRTYAGLAEVCAMRGQTQEALRAMGLAYENYPMQPELDPAYPYLRASRYSLYVFGDAQSRLFLDQPKEAERALLTTLRETNDPEVEPITKLDLLYYQAEAQIQQGDLEAGMSIMSEAAILAKALGSRLYFNKLAVSYHALHAQWAHEQLVLAHEELFQPW